MRSTPLATPTFFGSGDEFRTWLERHGGTAAELLIGFHTVASGRAGITYQQALDHALCFGWIDGVRRNLDATSYTVRFSPRQSRSHWSRINLARVAELKKLGLMTAPGLAAFARRGAVRTIDYSYELKAAALTPAFERAFRAKPKAWAFFESQAPSYRRVAVFWVMSAKKEETRARRFAALVKDSAEGRRVGLASPGAASRSKKPGPPRKPGRR